MSIDVNVLHLLEQHVPLTLLIDIADQALSSEQILADELNELRVAS